jgi:DMSO/TMAO reductase YedYZ molybdopterin-dependent catalytic subunit
MMEPVAYSRRHVLALAAGAALVVHVRRLSAADCRASFTDIADGGTSLGRGVEAYDLTTLKTWLTPNETFFVREHFWTPAKAQRLEVGGKVAKPTSFTIADLGNLGHDEAVITLECAGNSIAQAQGLVSTARWGGVRLRKLLDRVGPVAADHVIVFTAADSPGEGNEPYARAMKVSEALEQDALLAWEMNGKPLPDNHGAPLRLVVPGWYGMASVKWLTRIDVQAEPFGGRFQTKNYVNPFPDGKGGFRWEPVTRIGLKSVVAAVESTAGVVRLRGATWGGVVPIARVAVTVDGGKTWRDATLERDSARHAWRLWQLEWKAPAPGTYVVASQAFDAEGGAQPLGRPPELANAPYARNEVTGRNLEIACDEGRSNGPTVGG